MKKIFALALMVALLCCAVCGAETVQIANPWREVTADELMQTVGVRFGVPEGAENVMYMLLETQGLAEMQFMHQGVEYNARIVPAAEFTDISGAYYDWPGEEACEIGWCAGKVMTAEDEGRTVSLCLWYDAAPGLMYSLFAAAPDGVQLDMLSIAAAVYIPAQDEADGGPTIEDMMFELLAGCTGYAGTAGSSLKDAAAAFHLAGFAVDYQVGNMENLSEMLNAARGRFDATQREELDQNLVNIRANLEAACSGFDSIAGLFEDAGVVEEMRGLLAIPDAANHILALCACL